MVVYRIRCLVYNSNRQNYLSRARAFRPICPTEMNTSVEGASSIKLLIDVLRCLAVVSDCIDSLMKNDTRCARQTWQIRVLHIPTLVHCTTDDYGIGIRDMYHAYEKLAHARVTVLQLSADIANQDSFDAIPNGSG